MYLYKSGNCVYYTRICVPKSLRSQGYPFDFKISLLTKERTEAIVRGMRIASEIKQRLAVTPPQPFEAFKEELTELVASQRDSLHLQSTERSGEKQPASVAIDSPPLLVPVKPWLDILDDFISAKESQKVKPLTCRQLRQRVSVFFTEFKIDTPRQVSSALLMAYVTWLNNNKPSQKTCREYYSALT